MVVKRINEVIEDILMSGGIPTEGVIDLQNLDSCLSMLTEDERKKIHNKHFSDVLSPKLKKKPVTKLDLEGYELIPNLSIWTPSGYMNKKIYVQNDNDKYTIERQDDYDEIKYRGGDLFSFSETGDKRGVRLLTSSEWYQSRDYFEKTGCSEIAKSFGGGRYSLNNQTLSFTSTVVDFDRNLIIQNPLINKGIFVTSDNGLILGDKIYNVDMPKRFKQGSDSRYQADLRLEDKMFDGFDEFFDIITGKLGCRKDKSYTGINFLNSENLMKGIRVVLCGKDRKPEGFPGSGWYHRKVIFFPRLEDDPVYLNLVVRYCYEPK